MLWERKTYHAFPYCFYCLFPLTLFPSDTKENIGAVPQGHDRVALMGDGPTDPRGDLESNGFKMRRIVLTPRVRRSQ